MPTLRIQNLKIDSDTKKITSGTASIKESRYLPKEKWIQSKDSSKKPYHSVSVTRENLGRILYLSDDRKKGIFKSPTRGIVYYDSFADEFSPVDKNDERIKHLSEEMFPEQNVHTVFGDCYLLLNFLRTSKLLGVLRNSFGENEQYERLLMHIFHGILKDGSKIKCSHFIQKSYASYFLRDVSLPSLECDFKFYSDMGSDKFRLEFFKNLTNHLKTIYPDFGKGCFVDSTPLPNDIKDNPFNALCSHGVAGASVQTRLVLVLDRETGLPVWYEIIPGNVLDLSTVANIAENVYSSIGVTIESAVLDAGYVTQDLLKSLGSSEGEAKRIRAITARMPAKKGYPHKELYEKNKRNIANHKCDFLREGHSYFGKKETIELFGTKINAYVYVDRTAAQIRYDEFIKKHEDEFNKMTDKEKNWLAVKFGFFILLSGKDAAPKEILCEYFERTKIENVFKTSKEYLHLLPLSKWNETSVRGKIFADIINTIILLLLRKEIRASNISISELFGVTQSWMCFYSKRNDEMLIETPNTQTKEFCKLLGIKKSPINIKHFSKEIENVYQGI